MTPRFLSVCGLALLFALPGQARAGEVRLTIQDGRVALSARDTTLRQILIEWERVGGTRVFNRDRIPMTPVTIELANVPEAQALATLLRSIAGYVATERLDPAGGASRYSRIILMPGEAAPWAAASAAAGQTSALSGPGGGPPGRPPLQRRVMPDGRVVIGMDDPGRTGDADDNDDNPTPPGPQPGLMRPPFVVPQRMQQGQADEPTQVDTGQYQTTPTTSRTSPAAAVSISTPGSVPATKQISTSPIKPPGD